MLIKIPSTNLLLLKIKGVILSGSPASVNSANAPLIDLSLIQNYEKFLCYGAQLIAHQLGGTVVASETREYGILAGF